MKTECVCIVDKMDKQYRIIKWSKIKNRKEWVQSNKKAIITEKGMFIGKPNLNTNLEICLDVLNNKRTILENNEIYPNF